MATSGLTRTLPTVSRASPLHTTALRILNANENKTCRPTDKVPRPINTISIKVRKVKLNYWPVTVIFQL
jgi:hypothetical protein